MHAQTLGQIVLLLHLGWVVWLAAGLPAGLALPGWERLRLAHGASLGGQLGLQLAGLTCPLTALEEWLRGSGFSYHGSWLASWLQGLVYVEVPPGAVLAVTACWLAATIASLILWRPAARPC